MAEDRFESLVARIADWTEEEVAHACPRQVRHIAQGVLAGADPTYPPFAPSAAETCFGPADAPSLPLGLRRHPRYAARLGAMWEWTAYAHDEPGIREIASRFPESIALIERWDELALKWVDLEFAGEAA